MSKCYICGPMAGLPNLNHDAFDAAQVIMEKIGWEVVSPAEIDRGRGIDATNHHKVSYEDFMQVDLHEITAPDVDALVLLPGWGNSKGGRMEIRVAIWTGKQIYALLEGQLYDITGRVIEDLLSDAEEKALKEAMRHPLRDAMPKITWKRGPVEYRVVSETGGMKGQKDARFGLIPPEALREVAICYGKGAEKYTDEEKGTKGDWNWAKGYSYSLSIDALERHLNLWKSGESMDADGFHHLAAVCFHAMTLIDRELHAPEQDDRRDIYRGSGN